MKLLKAVGDVPPGVVLVLALLLGVSVGCSGGAPSATSGAPSNNSAPPNPAFPVVPSADKRSLQDQNGTPFPILGRTAWFITSLAPGDYQTFLDDTAAKGYNAIELMVITHYAKGNQPPFGANGTLLPFTKRLDGSNWTGALTYTNINNEAPDFSLPNEAFWAHVDGLLAYAESKGILCFMFPAYVGFQGGDQGWMAEMTANGAAKMTAYGTFIASRYVNQKNIVWMLGGDYGTGSASFTASQLAVEKAMLAGMKSVAAQQSVNFSAEWNSESIYTDQGDATLRAAGTLQGAYSFAGDVNTLTRKGYANSPVMPTFLLEEPYDEEGPSPGNNTNPAATQPVRRFQWWGVLSGTGGYISGNGFVWPFNTGVWQGHLNTQGAQDMARLNAFVRSIAWYNLVPSGLAGMKTLVSGNSLPNADTYVAAAATPDGTLLVAYVPPAHSGTITIDMTAMIAPARARWFNPASAVYTPIGMNIANTGPSVFTTPGNNGTGSSDWVLVLDTP
jgi:hypothetical protein